MVTVTAPLEGDIVAKNQQLVAARQALIAQCVERYSGHSWYLHLNPFTPTTVDIQCEKCPAGMDDVWPGSLEYVHMRLPAFSIVDGTHTAKETVDLPVSLFIRESRTMDVLSFEFRNTMEVKVTPRTPAITDATGTGWCAPSP